MKKVIFSAVLFLMSCTDAQMAKTFALGDDASVKCYSGDTIIYEGRSTGKLSNSENSDGYYFKDSKTRKLIEVSGNCVVVYN